VLPEIMRHNPTRSNFTSNLGVYRNFISSSWDLHCLPRGLSAISGLATTQTWRSGMKNKHLWFVALIGLLVLVASVGAVAQNRAPERLNFSGLINAYSPQTSTTGPYEVRGTWNLLLRGNSGKADFSATLNMVLSDGWVLTLGDKNFDPSVRGAHTHHVTLRNATVTPITGGFKVNGTATITANGTNNPMISPSPVEVDIVGGTNVKFSNVTLTFGAPASNHFGTEPLPGVVQRPGE
jgi:hypothetical protein